MSKKITVLSLLLGTLMIAGGCGGSAPVKRSMDSEIASKVRLAHAYLRGGRVGAAMKEMDEALELNPDSAGLQNSYGWFSMSTGRNTAAEAAFRKALELDPYLSDAHNNLGILYTEMGRGAEAESEYLKTLENPAYRTPEKVHLNLGILYVSQGRDEKALKTLRRAVELNPKYFQAHYELAGLLERTGNLDEAAREYEVASQEYGKKGEFHYRLGLVYFRLGNTDKASEHLREVLELTPGSENAAQAGEILRTIK